MKLKTALAISLIGLLLISCSEPEKYIIAIDYSQLLPDTINGETEKESNRKYQEFNKELLANTINKTIPVIEISTVDGEKMNLQDILSDETILISSDNHCGWGLEGLTNDFPNAIKELEKESLHFNVICLLKRGDSDIEKLEFINTLNELNQIYESVYIIDETEARKINLFSNPVRFYINSEKVVKHIGSGTSLIENNLLNEIKLNTGANNTYPP